MPNPVVHFEIISGQSEPDVKDFYASLFDWKVNADNPMNYGMVDTGGGEGIGGGISGGAASRTTMYVQVPDLEATLQSAEKLGGRTVMPVTDIPGAVTMAMFSDPAGNVIGIIKG